MTMATQQEGKDETLHMSEMELLSSSGDYQSDVSYDELPTRYISLDENKLWKYPGVRKNRSRMDYKSHVIAPRTIIIKRESEETVSVEFYGHNSEGEKTSTKLLLKDEAGYDNVKIIIGDYVVSSRGEITELAPEKLPDTTEEDGAAKPEVEAKEDDPDSSERKMTEDPIGIDTGKKVPCVTTSFAALSEGSLAEDSIEVEQNTALVETEIGRKENESEIQALEAERSHSNIRDVGENISVTDVWRWWRFNGPVVSVNVKENEHVSANGGAGVKPEVVDVNEILKDWYRWYL
ncbi:unnamed protein product [Orchesella dallaii]|uniref:Uncharacterized protein n=1 Tax=Orchesella dallaii TaxID=48710 RepID=A0ABP1S966_9HEXA